MFDILSNPTEIILSVVNSPDITVANFRRLLMLCGVVDNPEVFFDKKTGVAIDNKFLIYNKLKNCSIGRKKLRQIHTYFKSKKTIKNYLQRSKKLLKWKGGTGTAEDYSMDGVHAEAMRRNQKFTPTQFQRDTTQAEAQARMAERAARVFDSKDLIPRLKDVVSTRDGIVAQIENYDPAYTWTSEPTATSEIELTAGILNTLAKVILTGVKPGAHCTVIVKSSTVAGGHTTEARISGKANPKSTRVKYEEPLSIDRGFTVDITNSIDDSFSYEKKNTIECKVISSDGGECDSRNPKKVRVSGLQPGKKATIEVINTIKDHEPSEPVTITGVAAEGKALIPALVEKKGKSNCIITIQNFDPAWEWYYKQKGPETNIKTERITTSNPGSITVRSVRENYTDGSATLDDISPNLPHTPKISKVVTSTDGGFEAQIENYDNNFDWKSTVTNVTNGSVTITPRQSTGWFNKNTSYWVVVTNLKDGEKAHVTVTTDHADFNKGEQTFVGTSMLAPLVPELNNLDSQRHGFTFHISNFDRQFQWTLEVPTRRTKKFYGNKHDNMVTVQGMKKGEVLEATVITSAPNYKEGKQTIKGTAGLKELANEKKVAAEKETIAAVEAAVAAEKETIAAAEAAVAAESLRTANERAEAAERAATQSRLEANRVAAEKKRLTAEMAANKVKEERLAADAATKKVKEERLAADAATKKVEEEQLAAEAATKKAEELAETERLAASAEATKADEERRAVTAATKATAELQAAEAATKLAMKKAAAAKAVELAEEERLATTKADADKAVAAEEERLATTKADADKAVVVSTKELTKRKQPNMHLFGSIPKSFKSVKQQLSGGLKAGLQLLSDNPNQSTVAIGIICIFMIIKTLKHRKKKSVHVLDLIKNDILSDYKAHDKTVKAHAANRFKLEQTKKNKDTRYVWAIDQIVQSQKNKTSSLEDLRASLLNSKQTSSLTALHFIRENGTVRSSRREIHCALFDYAEDTNEFLERNIKRIGKTHDSMTGSL